MVGVIDYGLLRIVDVVDDKVAFVAGDDSLAVGSTEGGSLHDGHTSVPIGEGDAVLHVYSCLVFHTRRGNFFEVVSECHEGEVDGVYTQHSSRRTIRSLWAMGYPRLAVSIMGFPMMPLSVSSRMVREKGM